jgi:hypothetical protein
MLLVACALGPSGCLRFGYDQRPSAADGGRAPAAGRSSDAAVSFDASTLLDAAVSVDAAGPRDAAISVDASARADAAPPLDASSSLDVDARVDASLGPATSDAGPSCNPSAASDYCTHLPALAQPPQLDGVLDCGPALIDLPAAGWNSTGSLPSDNHARYAAAWRPDGLYFYVEVDDMLVLPALAADVDPWCGDGVELYVDADGRYVSAPDYDDPGAIQLLATAPARDTGTTLAVDARYHTRSEQRVGDWAATRHITVLRDGGYALEAFVAAADLDLSGWQLISGGTVGLDIAINVSVADPAQKAACGDALGQYYLRLSRLPCSSDNCRPYSNAAAFCTTRLE